VPARWAVVDTFPLTPHGKVDMRRLDHLAEARA
jgi:non-ribosomal peptide synthetase component E (peptide arylation enzyme)